MSQDRFLEHGEPSPGDINIPDVVEFQETQGLDLPAPEIDLGGGVSEDSDKPLGPRRLALLREQMEQHAKEVAENQTDDPEHVDPELAQKQRRMAELTSRAALSSDEDRQSAERAMASHDEHEGDEAEGPETTSIPVGQVRRRDLRAQRTAEDDPEDADGVDGAGDGEDPQTGGPDEGVPDEGSSLETPPEVAPGPEHVEDEPAEPEPADSPHIVDDQADLDQADPEQTDPEQTDPERGGSLDDEPEPQTPVASPSAGEDVETEGSSLEIPDEESEPATPVSALDAEGLELLEPSEYRQSNGVRTILLVLGAMVLLAVAVVVLMILL